MKPSITASLNSPAILVPPPLWSWPRFCRAKSRSSWTSSRLPPVSGSAPRRCTSFARQGRSDIGRSAAGFGLPQTISPRWQRRAVSGRRSGRRTRCVLSQLDSRFRGCAEWKMHGSYGRKESLKTGLAIYCGRHSFCSHAPEGGRSLAEVRCGGQVRYLASPLVCGRRENFKGLLDDLVAKLPEHLSNAARLACRMQFLLPRTACSLS